MDYVSVGSCMSGNRDIWRGVCLDDLNPVFSYEGEREKVGGESIAVELGI